MIPRGLSNEHFFKAANQVDQEGVPATRRSVHYDLVLDGKNYPPKYIISLAAKFATGTKFPSSDFNAVEAKNYFLAKGYKVTDHRAGSETMISNEIIVDEDDESAFPEGSARFRMHRDLERDRNLTKKAKKKRLAETGALRCEVCTLDFAQRYGELGKGFIEAHHTTPVSDLDGTTRTKIADLALVYSNCHRMLHRGPELLSVDQLRKLVANTSVQFC